MLGEERKEKEDKPSSKSERKNKGRQKAQRKRVTPFLRKNDIPKFQTDEQ